MRPPKAQSAEKSTWLNAKPSRPLAHGKSHPIMSNISAHSSIVDIGFPFYPSTVGRFVVAIVIYSVNLVFFRWLLAHIGNKVSERLFPSFTHFNTPAAVVFVSSIILVLASPLEGCPRFISCCMPKPVPIVSRSSLFVIPAPTTPWVPPLECMAGRTDHLSAITLASPQNLHSVGVVGALVTKSCQSTEPLASDVNKFAHNKHYNASVVCSQPIHETIA